MINHHVLLAALVKDGELAGCVSPEWVKRFLGEAEDNLGDQPGEADPYHPAAAFFAKADSHLLHCLKHGRYFASRDRMVRTLVSPRTAGGPGAKVFKWDGREREDSCPTAVAFIRQIVCLFKKVKSTSEDNADAFFDQYLDVDRGLPLADHNWDPLDPDCFGHRVDFNSYRPRLVGEVLPASGVRVASLSGALSSVFGLVASHFRGLTPLEMVGRHGPGATVENPVDKFDWPSWSPRLESFFSSSLHCYHAVDRWAEEAQTRPISDSSPPSKFVVVPKTYKGPRMIAIESVANQFCQQAVSRFLLDRLEGSPLKRFIRIRDQEPNRKLARLGSISGKFATVDLSEASDRLSLRLVERCFGSNRELLQALCSSRNHKVRCGRRGAYLRKFASMGNATTFPLQSLVFLGFALAATLLSEGKLPTAREIRKLRGRVQVYGDDIIVPSHAYPFLVDALGYFDLKVNFGKSFPTGNFRESCGLDAFRGEDVTPAYIRSLPGRSPEAFTSTLDTMNQLWLKGWWNLSETMGSVLELNKLPIRGPDDDVVGLVSFSGRTESHLAKRWNSTLQRLEVRRLTANAKRKTVRPEGYQGLLRFLTERSLEKPSRLDFISPRGRVELDLEKPRLILQSKWVTTSL